MDPVALLKSVRSLATDHLYQLGALLAVLAVLIACGAAPRRIIVRVVLIVAVALLALNGLYYIRDGHDYWDFSVFYRAGGDIRDGRNPYVSADTDAPPFLNPPSAFPLFRALAALPYRVSAAIWLVLNLVGILCLVPFAQRVLAAQDPACRNLPRWTTATLAGAVALSAASLWGIEAGQLTVLVAFCLLGALYLQVQERPVLAGVLLAVAAVKIATLLPFLLLFLRRTDRRTWVSLACTGLVLSCVSVEPRSLPTLLHSMQTSIADHAQPGQINDYGYEGPYHEDILAFDHLFYRLGMRDRGQIAQLQLALAAGLGLGLAYVLTFSGLPRGAACSLVCFYSVLFLYHRLYDTILLAVPLVYVTQRAAWETGWRRWLLAATALAVLAVSNLPRESMRRLTEWAPTAGLWGTLAEVLVLPYATWLCLVGMAAVYTACRAAAGPREEVVPVRALRRGPVAVGLTAPL